MSEDRSKVGQQKRDSNPFERLFDTLDEFGFSVASPTRPTLAPLHSRDQVPTTSANTGRTTNSDYRETASSSTNHSPEMSPRLPNGDPSHEFPGEIRDVAARQLAVQRESLSGELTNIQLICRNLEEKFGLTTTEGNRADGGSLLAVTETPSCSVDKDGEMRHAGLDNQTQKIVTSICKSLNQIGQAGTSLLSAKKFLEEEKKRNLFSESAQVQALRNQMQSSSRLSLKLTTENAELKQAKEKAEEANKVLEARLQSRVRAAAGSSSSDKPIFTGGMEQLEKMLRESNQENQNLHSRLNALQKHNWELSQSYAKAVSDSAARMRTEREAKTAEMKVKLELAACQKEQAALKGDLTRMESNSGWKNDGDSEDLKRAKEKIRVLEGCLEDAKKAFMVVKDQVPLDETVRKLQEQILAVKKQQASLVGEFNTGVSSVHESFELCRSNLSEKLQQVVRESLSRKRKNEGTIDTEDGAVKNLMNDMLSLLDRPEQGKAEPLVANVVADGNRGDDVMTGLSEISTGIQKSEKNGQRLDVLGEQTDFTVEIVDDDQRHDEANGSAEVAVDDQPHHNAANRESSEIAGEEQNVGSPEEEDHRNSPPVILEPPIEIQDDQKVEEGNRRLLEELEMAKAQRDQERQNFQSEKDGLMKAYDAIREREAAASHQRMRNAASIAALEKSMQEFKKSFVEKLDTLMGKGTYGSKGGNKGS